MCMNTGAMNELLVGAMRQMHVQTLSTPYTHCSTELYGFQPNNNDLTHSSECILDLSTNPTPFSPVFYFCIHTNLSPKQLYDMTLSINNFNVVSLLMELLNK